MAYDKILRVYKSDSIKIARQLGYSSAIIDKIKQAESINEVTHALRCGRHEMEDG